QAAAAAEALQDQASVLSQAVAVFTFEGVSATAHRAPAPRLAQPRAAAASPTRLASPASSGRSLPRPSKPKDDEWAEF
ncbi:MAG TPA: methyl-accepting chemotaxis protein, partial [Pseudomonas sp.]|nr:methyl-accepting chemotaxis protein [Pseudomonas sp.]